MSTVKSIALKAGVSVSTVSRVLNNQAKKYRISAKTEQRVNRIAQELNYRPNELARSLRLKKTNTIGLVVPDISNPFFAGITRNIQQFAHRFGYSLIVCNTDEDVDLEIEHLDLLLSKGVDGLVLMPVGQRSNHMEKLLNDNFPVVLIDRCFDNLDFNSVFIDNFQGAFEATEYLIRRGHRRIAIIQGLPDTNTSIGRLNGYKKAFSEYHLPIDEALIVGKDFRRENGYIETKFLLNMVPPPTALFTTSDLITLGALQAIYEERKTVPNDISLIAFDDIDFAPYLACPLTVVAQPKEIIGEIAVKMLIEKITNPNSIPAKKIKLKTQLIIRDSVKPL